MTTTAHTFAASSAAPASFPAGAASPSTGTTSFPADAASPSTGITSFPAGSVSPVNIVDAFSFPGADASPSGTVSPSAVGTTFPSTIVAASLTGTEAPSTAADVPSVSVAASGTALAVPSSAAKQTFSTKELVLGGMFAAVMAVISQLSIPMPTGVPITVQMFGVTLVGAALGWRLGLFATITYILIGAVGLPVFSNFRGGLGVLTGVTGGYLWSYPCLTALSGISPKTKSKTINTLLIILSTLLGVALVETAGGLQWAALSGDKTVAAVFAYSMVAFVPKDILISVLAVFIGLPIRRMISRLNQ